MHRWRMTGVLRHARFFHRSSPSPAFAPGTKCSIRSGLGQFEMLALGWMDGELRAILRGGRLVNCSRVYSLNEAGSRFLRNFRSRARPGRAGAGRHKGTHAGIPRVPMGTVHRQRWAPTLERVRRVAWARSIHRDGHRPHDWRCSRICLPSTVSCARQGGQRQSPATKGPFWTTGGYLRKEAS